MQLQFGNRNIVLFIFYGIILSFIGCSKSSYVKRKLPLKEEFATIRTGNYLFLKCDTISYQYNNLLYFKKNDSTFIVVTEKENQEPCNYLVINNSYKLKLKSVRSNEILNYLDYINSYEMFNKEIIKLIKEDSVLWDLYTTPYIRDLCYQED